MSQVAPILLVCQMAIGFAAAAGSLLSERREGGFMAAVLLGWFGVALVAAVTALP